MNDPMVSLIAPCYNGEKYLDNFLQSVLNQTYRNLELILVNDGSTDTTEEKVLSYTSELSKRGIHLIYLYQNNAGQAAALNRGLKQAQGQYISWMDADDGISPEFIEKEVTYLEGHSEYAFCRGKAVSVMAETPDRIESVFGARDDNRNFFEDILFHVQNVFFSGYMARAEALDQAIPSREIYAGPGGQNAQLLLPLSWYFGEPGYVEEAVYKYYIHQDSHSHSQDSCEKVIRQLYNYEKILVETLRNIPDQTVRSYIPKVQENYSRLRFGNAIDTKNAQIIREQYYERKLAGFATARDRLLFWKYTNPMIRKLVGV